jgi:hypothetical protein
VAGIGELGRVLLVVAGEGHRFRAIEEDVGAKVRLVLKQLDVVLIGAGEDLPVNGAQIIAGRIGAVIEILDGKPVVGTAMPAGEEPLHHLPGDQLHVADTGETIGIEVFLAHRDDHERRRETTNHTNDTNRRQKNTVYRSYLTIRSYSSFG